MMMLREYYSMEKKNMSLTFGINTTDVTHMDTSSPFMVKFNLPIIPHIVQSSMIYCFDTARRIDVQEPYSQEAFMQLLCAQFAYPWEIKNLCFKVDNELTCLVAPTESLAYQSIRIPGETPCNSVYHNKFLDPVMMIHPLFHQLMHQIVMYAFNTFHSHLAYTAWIQYMTEMDNNGNRFLALE